MAEQADVAKLFEDNLAAFNARDWAAVAATYAADIESEEVATHERTKGVEAQIESTKRLTTAFPDLRSNITNLLVCGDHVTVENTFEGTHTGAFTGPFGTIPPTGKHVTLRVAGIGTIEDGKFKTWRVYFDSLTLLQQLGVAPAPTAAAGGVR